MNIKNCLERYSQVENKNQTDWKFSSIAELVLHYGFEMKEKSPLNIRKGVPRYCYHNCQKIAKKKGLTYVEGYAISNELKSYNIAVPHAWILDHAGKIVELTWQQTGEDYLGIPLDFDWVQKVISQRRKKNRNPDLSILTSSYLENFLWLKDGLPPESLVTNI